MRSERRLRDGTPELQHLRAAGMGGSERLKAARRAAAKGPEVRPWPLRYLAAVLVAATLLDAFNLQIGIARNLSTLCGFALVFGFVLTRAARARYFELPGGLIVLFVILTGSVVVARALLIASSEALYGLRLFTQYVKVVILYVILFDLARDPRVVRLTGAAFVAASFLMSLVVNLNIEALMRSKGGRVGAEGLNLNQQALLYTLGILAVFGWLLSRWPRLRLLDVGLIGAAASMLVALVQTASRGGAAALLIGVAVALSINLRKGKVTAYVTLVPAVLFGIGVVMLSGEVLHKRVTNTIEAGDTGLRVELVRTGSEMFLERPFLGWGTQYSHYLGEAMGKNRMMAAHNAFFQVLLAFGLVGFVPWALGIAASLAVAWRCRTSPWGSIVVTLLMAVLASGLTLNVAYEKVFWVVLAFAGRARALADEPLIGRRRVKQRFRPLNAVPPGQRAWRPPVLAESAPGQPLPGRIGSPGGEQWGGGAPR